MITPPKKPDSMPSQEDFAQIVRNANDGDQEALAEMRALLDDNPEIWRHMGDLSRYAQESILSQIAGPDQLIKESLRRTAKELMGELTTESCSPIERLAAERIVGCWMECHYVDMLHPLPQGATLTQQKFHLNLKTSAQKRYEQSMRSLVVLKKLLAETRSSGNATKLAVAMPSNGTQRQPIRQRDPHNRMQVYFEEAEPSGV